MVPIAFEATLLGARFSGIHRKKVNVVPAVEKACSTLELSLDGVDLDYCGTEVLFVLEGL